MSQAEPGPGGMLTVEFQPCWEQLRDVILKLMHCESVDRDQWNGSFNDVYALCNARPVSHAPILYSSTTTIIVARVRELWTELATTDDSRLLMTYIQMWQSFYYGLTCLDNLCRSVPLPRPSILIVIIVNNNSNLLILSLSSFHPGHGGFCFPVADASISST